MYPHTTRDTGAWSASTHWGEAVPWFPFWTTSTLYSCRNGFPLKKASPRSWELPLAVKPKSLARHNLSPDGTHKFTPRQRTLVNRAPIRSMLQTLLNMTPDPATMAADPATQHSASAFPIGNAPMEAPNSSLASTSKTQTTHTSAYQNAHGL